MMRPRKRNVELNLPPCVYLSHGSYYKVVGGIWHRLGKTLPESEIVLTRLPTNMPMARKATLAYAYKVLTTARQNAKKRKVVGFSLTRDDMHRMLNEAGWRCSVTGMEFTLEVIGGRKPFAPSIDRMDCAKGYAPGNCRVVCLAVNYAMNVWGEEVFRRMLSGLKRQSIRLPNTPLGAASVTP